MRRPNVIHLQCGECGAMAGRSVNDIALGTWLKEHAHEVEQRAEVTLFKPSGKYYTTDQWRIPQGAIGPYDMERSPDWRRISGGAVLVDTQEPWGFPHLFPGETS